MVELSKIRESWTIPGYMDENEVKIIFENYKNLKGKITDFDDFTDKLAAFYQITCAAFTAGRRPFMDRDEAWAAWQGYLSYHKLKSEASKIFEAVDKFSAYS